MIQATCTALIKHELGALLAYILKDNKGTEKRFGRNELLEHIKTGNISVDNLVLNQRQDWIVHNIDIPIIIEFNDGSTCTQEKYQEHKNSMGKMPSYVPNYEPAYRSKSKEERDDERIRYYFEQEKLYGKKHRRYK